MCDLKISAEEAESWESVCYWAPSAKKVAVVVHAKTEIENQIWEESRM